MRQKFFDPQNGLKTQKKAFFFFLEKFWDLGFRILEGRLLGKFSILCPKMEISKMGGNNDPPPPPLSGPNDFFCLPKSEKNFSKIFPKKKKMIFGGFLRGFGGRKIFSEFWSPVRGPHLAAQSRTWAP